MLAICLTSQWHGGETSQGPLAYPRASYFQRANEDGDSGRGSKRRALQNGDVEHINGAGEEDDILADFAVSWRATYGKGMRGCWQCDRPRVRQCELLALSSNRHTWHTQDAEDGTLWRVHTDQVHALLRNKVS